MKKFFIPALALAAASVAVPAMAQSYGYQDRDDRGGRYEQDRLERQPREDERPRVSMGEAVQRASSGRPGRFLGASSRGDTIVVRWEYPGGRVADIMLDARTGRVVGER